MARNIRRRIGTAVRAQSRAEVLQPAVEPRDFTARRTLADPRRPSQTLAEPSATLLRHAGAVSHTVAASKQGSIATLGERRAADCERRTEASKSWGLERIALQRKPG